MDNVRLLANTSCAAINCSTNDTRTPQTPQSGITARVAVSVLLMVFIIVGNSLVILAYNKNHRLRTGTYTFLVSLAISDFLVGSVSLPLWIYGSVVTWRQLDAFAIMFIIYFDILSALASIFHLTAVSIERFVAISRPFLYQRLTRKPYVITIILIWCLAFVLASLHPRILTTVSPFFYFKIHGTILFLLGYLAPLIIISAVNIGIFKIARKIVLRCPERRESRANSVTKQAENAIQRRIPKERKTAITLVLVTGLFFLAWLPFFIVNMMSLYCLHTCWPEDYEFNAMIAEFTKWCHYSNSAANAIVYAFRDVEMRRTFMTLLLPCWSRHRAVDPVTFDTNNLRTRHDSSISANGTAASASNKNERQNNNQTSGV